MQLASFSKRNFYKFMESFKIVYIFFFFFFFKTKIIYKKVSFYIFKITNINMHEELFYFITSNGIHDVNIFINIMNA
jgi:hypothetical protein